MTLPVTFRPDADADLVEARDWYEQKRAGLGDEFVDRVDEFIERISRNPKACPVAVKGIRRGKVERFPYVVYYRELRKSIEVIGVLHGSRDPQIWQDRA
jgi:plasmid stabilization system protein ParE